MVPVLKVTDGDTIHVLYQGRDERVRLIGVNTPEVSWYGGRAQCFGVEAARYARDRLSGRVVRLGRTQVGLAQQEADPAEARRGERAVEQGEAERDGFVVAAVGDHGLERDQLSLRLVRSGRGLGEEELDRLARAAGDVFERGQRRPGASCLDQVDRRCGDMTLAQLGQAQA